MYKIFVLLGLLFCCYQPLQAQIKTSKNTPNSTIDSLSRLFESAKDNATKIKIMVNAPGNADEYYKKTSQILSLYYKAIKIAEAVGDKKSAIKLLYDAGYLEVFVKNDEPAGFKSYSKALAYAEEMKDYESAAKLCYKTGAIYEHQNFRAEMYKYWFKAIEYNQKTSVFLYNAYRWQVSFLLEDNRIDEALVVSKQAVSQVDSYSLPNDLKVLAYGYHYSVLRRIPSKKQDADVYKQKIIQLISGIKTLSETNDYDAFATICYDVEQYKQAIFFENQQLQRTDEEIKLDFSKIETYRIISASYEQLGDYPKSLEYYKKYSTVYLNTLKNQVSLESGRKVIKAEGERNLILKQNELEKEKFYRNISFAVAAFIVVLGALILFFYRREQKRKIELSQLNATKDKLFAILSHDFRSPLANLQTFMSLINWGAISQAEFAKSAKDFSLQLNNVQSMLENILTWSISQMGGMIPKIEESNLRSIIEEQINLYQPVAYAKDIEVINEINQAATVCADGNHLTIIFRNLLQNALKFTDLKGKIVFNFREDGKRKMIEISDNGIGLSAEKLKNIFELDKSTSGLGTHFEQGTGLGLTLVRELVEINKGEIRVQSTLGVGTTFTIHFR